MSKIKQQSTIKDMILATISEHIDQQNAKGMEKYGQSIDDCPVEDKKDVRIKELEWRVKELQGKNELVIEERNAAREFLRQEREKSKEIIEDQADEIEGLQAEIADLRSQPNHAQLKGDMLTNLMKLYLQEVEG